VTAAPAARLRLEDVLLLAAVVGLPWAFGGVEQWAYRAAAFLIVLAAAVALWREGPAGLGLTRRSLWLAPAFLLGLWAAVQLLPLPPTIVKTLSPRADEIYQLAFPGYPGAAPEDLLGALEARGLERVPELQEIPAPDRATLGWNPQFGGRWSGWRSLSLTPSIGLERLHWYGALLLAFLLARRRLAERAISHRYRTALFGLFLALSVFGLIYAATSNGKLYWFRETLQQARAFGPYLNPTNFAGVIELGAPWLAGCALDAWRRRRAAVGGDPLTPLWAAAALLGFVAALATASKSSAVLLTLALSLVCVLALSSLRQRLLLLLGISGLGAVCWFGLQQTALGARIQQFLDITAGGYGDVGRIVAWKASLPMLADYPLTGIGFGAFRDVFRHYVPAGESALWAQLHNDYFQVVVEGGWIAGGLLAWLTVAYWFRLIRRGSWVGERGWRLGRLGLALGLVSLSLHAVYDFNHQIPANALLFVVLAAFAVSRAESAHARSR